ncbi:uncharacterized protein ISCGN_017984 [Ixodes scapularis]
MFALLISFGVFHKQFFTTRAQSNIICLGSDAFSSVFGSILDGYRPVLTETAPLFIGDGDPLGLFDLRRGRVHNVNETYFRGKLSVECNDTHMDLQIPLKVKRPRIVYDVRQSLREVPLTGELHITMDLIDFDVRLLATRKKRAAPPLVSSMDILKLVRFKMTFHDMGLLGSLLNLALHTTHAMYGQPQEELFRILLHRALQRYADNYPLPI